RRHHDDDHADLPGLLAGRVVRVGHRAAAGRARRAAERGRSGRARGACEQRAPGSRGELPRLLHQPGELRVAGALLPAAAHLAAEPGDARRGEPAVLAGAAADRGRLDHRSDDETRAPELRPAGHRGAQRPGPAVDRRRRRGQRGPGGVHRHRILAAGLMATATTAPSARRPGRPEGQRRPERQRQSTWRRRDAATGYAFVAPAVIGAIAFVVGPLIAVAWYSLHEWNVLANTFTFVGAD